MFTLSALKALTIITLIFISFNTNARTQSNWIRVGTTSSGKPIMVSPTGNRYVSPHFEPFGGNYRGTSSGTGLVRGTTGAVSAGTVQTNAISQVAKKTVFANVLNNAKTYGKMGIRRAGWLGLAFSLAEMALKDKGIVWDDEKGDFVKPKDDSTYLVLVVSNDALSIPSNPISEKSYKEFCDKPTYDGKAKQCKMLGFVKSQEAGWQLGLSYCRTVQFTDQNGTRYGDSFGSNTTCATQGGYWRSDERVHVLKYDDYVPITQPEFDEIVEPIADADPNRWIEGSKPEEDGEIPGISKPIVTVLDGEVAQSPPYTDPKDGKSKQTRWEFETPPEGEGDPKVREIEIPRPDLTPNSPEAPTIDPDDIPKDDDTTGDNTTTDDKEQEPKEASAPFDLCKEHPEILACQQMGQPEAGMFDEISIPHVTDDTTWKEDAFLPSDGVCPAPKVFHVWGKAFSVSYEPLCELMRKVRFIVLIAFILMSAYVCFGSLRRE